MKTISFELTMPNVGSWNGKWSGSDRKYYIIKKFSDKFFSQQQHFKQLAEKGYDSFYYNFGDGWGASINVELIDSLEARRRKKVSNGFSGYDWMVDSIIYNGEIKPRKLR